MPKKTKPRKKVVKKSVVKAKPASRVAVTPSKSPKSPKSPRSPLSPLSVVVLGTDGKAAGKMTLPHELFAVKVNKPLLAQAVRVYLANQRSGAASTKTRGEVEGSTRKIYKQKGTGRARHGGIRAPIFVGGGIVFGPKPRDYSLKMPKAMKKSALASALTSQLTDGNIIVVDGLDKLAPKTKFMAKALTAVVADFPARRSSSEGGSSRHILLVTTQESDGVMMSARNLAGVDYIRAPSLNAYTLLAHRKIILMKEAVDEL